MDPRYFLSMTNQDRFYCKSCFIQLQDADKSPLVCASLRAFDDANETKVKEIEGIILPSHKTPQNSFHGYKCGNCETTKDIRFFTKCLICKSKQKTWCNTCLEQCMKCLDDSHLLVVERSPYSYWTEKLTESEMIHYNYQNRVTVVSYGAFTQGFNLFMAGQGDKALKFFVQFLERNQGVFSEEVISAYTHLGLIFQKLGKFDESLECAKKAFEVANKIYRKMPINPNTAHLYIVLGVAYLKLGQFESAIQPFTNAREISNMLLCNKREPESENAKSEDDILNYNLLSLANDNLSTIYRELEKYDQAIELLEESLKLKKSVNGDKRPLLADPMTGLALIYSDLQNYPKAMEYFLESHNIILFTHGKYDSRTANSYHMIGHTYSNAGVMDKAIEFLSIGLEIRLKVLGPKHFDTAASFRCLAIAYERMKNFDKALEYNMKELEVCKYLPRSEDRIANIHYANGYYYELLGERLKSDASYQESLKIKRTLKDVDIEPVLTALGLSHKDKREFHESVKYLIEAIKVNKEKNGKPKDLVVLLKAMVDICLEPEISDFENALKFLTEALKLYRLLENEKNELVDTLLRLGFVCANLSLLDDMIQFCNEGLELTLSIYGEYHAKTLLVYSELGNCYQISKQFPKALEYYQKASEVSKIYVKAIQTEESIQQNIELIKAGPTIQDNIKFHREIANSYMKLRQYKKAYEFYLKEIEIVEATEPEDAVVSCMVISGMFKEFKQPQYRFELELKALEISRRIQGVNNQLDDTEAYILERLGRYHESLEIIVRLMKNSESSEGANSKTIADSHSKIGNLYVKMNQYELAKESLFESTTDLQDFKC